MTSNPSSGKSAWVQLYQARRSLVEPEARTPGRPPALVPRHKVGLTLSQGEISEIEVWQERISNLMGRKISTGETVGILVRICTGRLSRHVEQPEFQALDQLVEWMIDNE